MCGQTVEDKLESLGERWGQVYVSYNPDGYGSPWLVSNKTDEGLPIEGETKTVRGESLSGVVDDALAGRLESEEW